MTLLEREMRKRNDAGEVGVTGYKTHIDYTDCVRREFNFNDDAFSKVLNSIKGLLDPEGILAQDKSGTWTK
ncbi:hypothetical protein QBC43DRAFT_293471 [Cladorrhinum sp. PSN259]|nr:hypothetical protein QBC43DRAFT_293471 [Cladorrhinum sp. PSN259]